MRSYKTLSKFRHGVKMLNHRITVVVNLPRHRRSPVGRERKTARLVEWIECGASDRKVPSSIQVVGLAFVGPG